VGKPALDPEEILKQLRAEKSVLVWEPLPPESPRPPTDNGTPRTRDSLEYLHANWALPDHFDPTAAGPGPRGKLVELFGRLTFRVLGPYFKKERDLLAHMVRVNETLERRCDDLVMRVQQLNADMLKRQADEARNQAKLALWLQLAPPAAAPSATNGKAPGAAKSRRAVKAVSPAKPVESGPESPETAP